MLRSLITKFLQRPFPRNLHALRRFQVSYGQFGEDRYLTTLLGHYKSDGVYVDVGCYHPIDLSNTYIFYQRGWRGVAIDPNPHWAREWRKYRPRDQFVNTAVSATTGSTFYLMNRLYPAFNRLVAEVPATLADHETSIIVPTRPLGDILDELLPRTPIDLLNVDCEGHDLEVLKTMNFSSRKPNVIAAEDETMDTGSPLSIFLRTQGYECKAYVGLTKIFQAIA